mgnify:FL=1
MKEKLNGPEKEKNRDENTEKIGVDKRKEESK